MTCTLAPPVHAFVEALLVETQHVLSDDQLNDALRDAITSSMHEHPIDSPDFAAGRRYKSDAKARKLMSLWKIAIEKLLTTTSFCPAPDVLLRVGLRMEDMERTRNPRVEEARVGEINGPQGRAEEQEVEVEVEQDEP